LNDNTAFDTAFLSDDTHYLLESSSKCEYLLDVGALRDENLNNGKSL